MVSVFPRCIYWKLISYLYNISIISCTRPVAYASKMQFDCMQPESWDVVGSLRRQNQCCGLELTMYVHDDFPAMFSSVYTDAFWTSKLPSWGKNVFDLLCPQHILWRMRVVCGLTYTWSQIIVAALLLPYCNRPNLFCSIQQTIIVIRPRCFGGIINLICGLFVGITW